MKLWQKILIALVLGLIAGILLGDTATYLKPVGDLFIRLIKMLIVPLVFFSLVAGVTSMNDTKTMGRMGTKAVIAYLVTTAFAISLGLMIGAILKPGAGVKLNLEANTNTPPASSFVDNLLNSVPTNPLAAMAEGNILQIIVFALFFGFSLNLLGERSKPIADFNERLAETMYKMTGIVMRFAPYGVFALIAWVAGTHGPELLLPLGLVILGVYLACFLHMALVYGGGLMLLGRLGPAKFFRKITDAQAIAFSTSSSSATLPVTLQVAREKLGVSKPTANVILPLGTTINMDGTAIYQGVCALFVAQALGVPLEINDYVTIILTATLASVGTAGIPGGGLIMLTLVLTAVGLPVEGVAIIAGIDRVLDMARTMVNVTGDAFVSVLIDKSEGTFDETQYKQ